MTVSWVRSVKLIKLCLRITHWFYFKRSKHCLRSPTRSSKDWRNSLRSRPSGSRVSTGAQRQTRPTKPPWVFSKTCSSTLSLSASRSRNITRVPRHWFTSKLSTTWLPSTWSYLKSAKSLFKRQLSPSTASYSWLSHLGVSLSSSQWSLSTSL